jgi:hypothetical protein
MEKISNTAHHISALLRMWNWDPLLPIFILHLILFGLLDLGGRSWWEYKTPGGEESVSSENLRGRMNFEKAIVDGRVIL